MRKIILSVFFASVYGGVAMAQSCVTPREKLALDVAVLKTSLMVAALSCGTSERYNAFMTAFQPYLMAQQQMMDGLFARVGGLAGRTQEDGFMTMLANDQSQEGLSQGAAYCTANGKEFDAVLALRTPDDLTTFVTAHPMPAPAVSAPCTVTPAPPAMPPRAPLTVIATRPLKTPPNAAIASNNHTTRRATAPAAKKPPKPAAPMLVQI